jgi:hypothetical protein
MSGTRSSSGPFARWYSILVKNKMAAPALCVAGMALGWSFVQGTRVTPHPYDDHIGYVGLRMIDVSALTFLITMIGFCAVWLTWTWGKGPKGRR